MATEKRFTVDYEMVYKEVMYLDNGNVMTVSEVVDLLNAQHEENMNLRAKHTQMIIILKDVVNDLKRMDTYRYAEHLEKIANLHFLSEKELEE